MSWESEIPRLYFLQCELLIFVWSEEPHQPLSTTVGTLARTTRGPLQTAKVICDDVLRVWIPVSWSHQSMQSNRCSTWGIPQRSYLFEGTRVTGSWSNPIQRPGSWEAQQTAEVVNSWSSLQSEPKFGTSKHKASARWQPFAIVKRLKDPLQVLLLCGGSLNKYPQIIHFKKIFHYQPYQLLGYPHGLETSMSKISQRNWSTFPRLSNSGSLVMSSTPAHPTIASLALEVLDVIIPNDLYKWLF